MYIEPNSQVQFFSDIGISQNYDTALYFSSTNEKDAYFNNLDKIASSSKVSYSRSNKGVIRLEANIFLSGVGANVLLYKSKIEYAKYL